MMVFIGKSSLFMALFQVRVIIYPDTVVSMNLQLVTHGSAVWGRNPRFSDSSFILPYINHWKGQFDGLSRDPLLAIEVPDGAPLIG